MKKMTFVSAMRDYFSYRPGTVAMDFLHEIKALTDKDRADFCAMLATVGYEVVSA